MPATYSSYLRCKSAMWMCFLLHSCIFTMTAQAIKMNINTLDVNVEPKGRNPILSFAGIPVLPIQTAQPSSWTPSKTAACTNGYCGDIRAVVELTANDIQGNTATVGRFCLFVFLLWCTQNIIFFVLFFSLILFCYVFVPVGSDMVASTRSKTF